MSEDSTCLGPVHARATPYSRYSVILLVVSEEMRRQMSAFIQTISPENSDNLYVASSVGAEGEREDRGGFVAAI